MAALCNCCLVGTVVFLFIVTQCLANDQQYQQSQRQQSQHPGDAGRTALEDWEHRSSASAHSQTGLDEHDVTDEAPVGQSTLSFVFDTTGSMYDDLVQVIDGAAKILATTLARREKIIYNYVLVPFHDPKVGPATVTTDPEEFQRQLRELYVQGGGDCPEMSITAIKQALELSLPNSFIYVFTDARAKDYHLTEKVLSLIQEKQSQVVFVLTGDCGNATHPGFKAYEQIASTSSGQVFLLRKSQVNQVLNFVRVAVQSRKVNLFSVDNQESGVLNYSLPVDSSLREFTVSVSGEKPKISIVNPKGVIQEPGVGDVNELLKLRKAQIVNVKDPMPGVWQLSVSAEGQHTIRITGLSAVDFEYGFSRVPVGSLEETDSRPVRGVPTHIILNVTDLESPGRIAFLELLNMTGHSVLQLPVKPVPGNPNLYTIDAFVPPSTFFYLKITGFDKDGFEFHRVAPTAVSPLDPQFPVVSMPKRMRGSFHEDVTLTCSVESTVPFSVQWYKEKEKLGHPLYFSESADATWTVSDATTSVEGLYACNASNVRGFTVAETFLDITDLPPVIVPPMNVSGVPTMDVEFTCHHDSPVQSNVTWYRLGDDISDSALRMSDFHNGTMILRNVAKFDEGPYVCRASNEGGFVEEAVWLLVEKVPEASVWPHTQSFVVGDTLTLTCAAVAYPPPQFIWRHLEEVLPKSERVTYDEQTGELTISDLRREDSGEYECVATNAAGVGTFTAHLNYMEGPSIVVPNRTVLVNNGETAILSCEAYGLPAPAVAWFLNGEEMEELSFVKMTKKGELMITGVQDTDAGDYECVATNEAGKSRAFVTLEVGSEPVIVEAPLSTGVDIHHNITLTCIPIGVPQPTISWIKAPDQPVQYNDRFHQLESGALFIRAISKEDEGMYTCVSENMFGRQEASAFITVTGIVKPLLAYSVPNVETIVGRTVRFTCQLLRGTPHPKITWYKQGEPVISGGRVEDDGHGNLYINNVEPEDVGEYTCVATNVGGTASHTARLNVQVPPEILDMDDRDFTAIVGQSTRLPCKVEGDPWPQVTWSKSGRRLDDTDPHYFIMEDGTLEIFSVSVADMATYSCTAINVAGSREKRVTLTIHVPPVLSETAKQHEDLVVIVNNPLQLSCDVEGTPTPTIEWYRLGELIARDRVGFTYLPNGALRIDGVQKEDAGIYECVASNEAGKATKMVNVAVQVPPTIAAGRNNPSGSGSGSLSTITTTVGSPVTLDCEASGDPKPTILWRKNFAEISQFDALNHGYVLQDSGSLHIPQVQIGDSGSYACIVENAAGVVTREYSLVVHEAPKLASGTPNSTSIIEFHAVTLACPIRGTPLPFITWYKNGEIVDMSAAGVRQLSDGSLELIHTEADDAGLYSCFAENAAGNFTHTIELTVFVPPRFGQNRHGEALGEGQEELRAILGSPVKLLCPADAIPPPQITWYKNGHEIQPGLSSNIRISEDGRMLEILSSESTDTGEYACIARNLAGEGERRFDVNILEPPKISESESSSRNLTVVADKSITIDCAVSGSPAPKVVWLKDDEELLVDNEPHMRLLLGGQRLEITQADLGDAGAYTCVAKNTAGKVHKNFYLDVWVPSKIERSEDVSKPQVTANRTITLLCPAFGVPLPQVTWFFNEVPITRNTSTMHIMDNGWKLQLNKVTVSDAGRYSCRAKNVAGESEKFFDLIVIVPPTIDKIALDLRPVVVENRSAVLNCPATGSPTPKIIWFRDNEVLDTLAYPNVIVLGDGQQLRITRVGVNDAKTYKCVVVNEAGEDAVEFALEVHVPATVDKTGIAPSVKVVVKKTATLKCPAMGTPTPDIVWYKDGLELDLGSSPNIHVKDSGRTLEITSIATKDSGAYECRAVNEAGEDRLYYNIEVHVPPEIDEVSSSPPLNQVLIDHTTVLSCIVNGNPKPSIKWLMNGQALALTARQHALAEGRQLEIVKAEVSDTGRYTCVASNEAGSADRDFHLEVLVPPYIDESNLNLNKRVIKGKPITIDCPVMGIPFPNMTWYRGTDVLETDDRTRFLLGGRQLEISDTTEDDAALYVCVGVNAAGKVRRDFDVEILVPPSIDDANIVDSPKIVVNRTVLLECPVSGVPPPRVVWMKNGLPLDISPDIKLLAGGRHLEISRAQVHHTARYTCLAANDAGKMERHFLLEVLVPPHIARSEETEFLTGVENHTMYIECPADGIPQPSVLWLKDKVPLLDLKATNARELSNGRQLELRTLQVTDAGEYTCLATNVAGQRKKNFRLDVHVPPRIPGSGTLVNVPVNLRRQLTLDCYATGYPEPRLTWYKDGEEVTLEGRRNMRVLRGGRVLQIVSASIEDTGSYTCKADNPAGSDQLQFQLEVLVPPKIEGSQTVTERSVTVGQSVTLDCPASGIPAPTIRWVRDGEVVSVGANPNLRLLEHGARLQVMQAQLTDVGEFTCIASNIVGNATKEYTLFISVPPSINEGPTEVGAIHNGRAVLPCEAIGLPDPTVQWWKGGELLPSSAPNYRQHPSGALEFSTVRVEDSGQYECVAANDVGRATKNIELRVQVPPKIENPATAPVKAVVGNAAELACEATGFPQPRITWQKGTRILTNVAGYKVLENGHLRIERADASHVGTYVCVAQNNAGTALGQVKLEVQVPPSIEEKETEIAVIQGKDVLLPCRAHGVPVPRISWEKDGHEIPLADFHYRLLRSGWLAIPITRVDDAGTYTCTAESDAGKDSINLNLIVYVPPVIESSIRQLTVSEGDVAELPCEASGFPVPKITWIHDGANVIQNSDRHRQLDSGMLIIGRVQAQDSGSYVCTAVNQVGKDSREILLRVQVAPVITVLPKDQEVTANSRIELECVAEGIPTPVITWRVNNTNYPAPPSINGRSRLFIDNAMKKDDGTYMCVAENAAGVQRALAAVRIKVAPKVLIPPSSLAVTLAEPAVLNCPVEGDPPANIAWTKRGQPVDFSDGRIEQLVNGSLVIHDAGSDDAGDYRCVATNEVGSSEGYAQLMVRSPPRIIVEPIDQNVEQGFSVTFDCVAVGEPVPTMTWRKEKIVLENGGRINILPNNSLKIYGVRLNDAGVYICMARNNLGSVFVQASLSVFVHGGWSLWSTWSSCTASCGPGTQHRTRTCDSPSAANGGLPCVGSPRESKACQNKECPINGGWGSWADWEACSQTCGRGVKVRSRYCDSPPPQYGGEDCPGAGTEKITCNTQECPVNGGWGEWSAWLQCSETCGEGLQERVRRCDNPRPQHGGKTCDGLEIERKPCRVKDCEIHGGWGPWSEWNACSLSCGGGTTIRRRACNSPSPTNGGRPCVGQDTQLDYCNKEPCPIHGHWAVWAEWGDCSASCDGGQRRRFRTCTNPAPRHNGRQCVGMPSDTETCNKQSCNANGQWAEWSTWSACTKTCDGGSQLRTRVCAEPYEDNIDCVGDATQVRQCNNRLCKAGLPEKATANIIGDVNGVEFGIERLHVNLSRTEMGMSLCGKMDLDNVPVHIGFLLQPLTSILSPIYWTTATEVGHAVNGYTLTGGNFRRSVQVEFVTGEILKMQHVATGVDADGSLIVDSIISGAVPTLPLHSQLVMLPYTEDYVQTGPGSIYAYSSRLFQVDGHSLPYAWNHTIEYEPSYGHMPFLVQRMSVDNIVTSYDRFNKDLQYDLRAAIAKAQPSNQCPFGFGLDSEGPYCHDVDECELMHPCSHTCINLPGSFSCTCPRGFVLTTDGRVCRDIDECEQGVAECHHGDECVNVVGSYKCFAKCPNGYHRNTVTLNCEDINECAEKQPVCEQNCRNTPGSYICECRKGFRASNSGRCLDVDECFGGNGNCSHHCNNTHGSYYCSCPPGYHIVDNFYCRDTNECEDQSHHCRADQECVNTQGAYKCISLCPSGFLRSDNSTCVDIDECSAGSSRCGYNQVCLNTVGSYYCACPRGYKPNVLGNICIDINECRQTPNPCSYACRNRPGTYECLCPAGHRLLADKKSCAGIEYLPDVQPFLLAKVSDTGCAQKLLGRKCPPPSNSACSPGFQLVNDTCTDVDECTERRSLCQHSCVNLPGSFKCLCPSGYKVAPNGRTCVDIDECTELRIDCGPEKTCFNKRGEFECLDTSCPANYERDPKTGQCLLECSEGNCQPGRPFADVLEFKVIALPSGISAYKDIIRLTAVDQQGILLSQTAFTVIDYEPKNRLQSPFDIRTSDGVGTVYTTYELQARSNYQIKVRATSIDDTVQYQTTFILFVAVSSFPY